MGKLGGIKKINTVNYGGKWISFLIFAGIVIPGVAWLIFDVILWPFVAIGAISLAVFLVIFFVEMHQYHGRKPYYEKHLKEQIPYDPQTQYAVIKSSICTGEKVAGFKDRKDGHFTEVMLIRSAEDERAFKEIYDIETIKTEY